MLCQKTSPPPWQLALQLGMDFRSAKIRSWSTSHEALQLLLCSQPVLTVTMRSNGKLLLNTGVTTCPQSTSCSMFMNKGQCIKPQASSYTSFSEQKTARDQRSCWDHGATFLLGKKAYAYKYQFCHRYQMATSLKSCCFDIFAITGSPLVLIHL